MRPEQLFSHSKPSPCLPFLFVIFNRALKTTVYHSFVQLHYNIDFDLGEQVLDDGSEGITTGVEVRRVNFIKSTVIEPMGIITGICEIMRYACSTRKKFQNGKREIYECSPPETE